MILDTNALSDFMEGNPLVGTILEGIGSHHLPAIVLGEYWFGLGKSKREGELRANIEGIIRSMQVLNVDAGTARHYAEIRSTLKSLGRPIPENDIWICALAIQHEMPIVSRDTHFDQIPGIKRIGW